MNPEHIHAHSETMKTPPVPRKEKFSAILLLLIGTVYLVVWIVSILSETASFLTVNDDKVAISKSELFSHARTIITILLSLVAAVGLFRKRRIGWIFGSAILILFFLICSGGLYQALMLGDIAPIAVAGTAWLTLITGIAILWISSTRARLNVTRPAVLTSLVITILLGLFYFFVQ
jgi:hypothetical protein